MKEIKMFSDSGECSSYEVTPCELIKESMTVDELRMAVRMIGEMSSLMSFPGKKKADYWVECINRVEMMAKAGSGEVQPRFVTRRYGLRQRLCEILGLEDESRTKLCKEIVMEIGDECID